MSILESTVVSESGKKRKSSVEEKEEKGGWVTAYAGTPPAIVAKLDKDINDVLKMPEIQQKMIDLGFDPVAGSGKDFAAVIDRDLPVWKDVVKKSGARAE
jgi:tripartite-type tricarboxylate transporter receptor subunit TctC